jgi:hypothetical protein
MVAPSNLTYILCLLPPPPSIPATLQRRWWIKLVDECCMRLLVIFSDSSVHLVIILCAVLGLAVPLMSPAFCYFLLSAPVKS